jgi:hypothetical protein
MNTVKTTILLAGIFLSMMITNAQEPSIYISSDDYLLSMMKTNAQEPFIYISSNNYYRTFKDNFVCNSSYDIMLFEDGTYRVNLHYWHTLTSNLPRPDPNETGYVDYFNVSKDDADSTYLFVISCGNYKILDDTLLILTDACTHVQWIYKYLLYYLYPLQVSACLKDAMFFTMGEKTSSKLKTTKFQCITKKQVEKWQKKQKKVNLFHEGIYHAGIFAILHVNNDATYQLYSSTRLYREGDFIKEKEDPSYKQPELLLSSGTWYRDGNVFVLHDTSLHHDFYALIHGDGNLQVLMFPDNKLEWFEEVK